MPGELSFFEFRLLSINVIIYRCRVFYQGNISANAVFLPDTIVASCHLIQSYKLLIHAENNHYMPFNILPVVPPTYKVTVVSSLTLASNNLLSFFPNFSPKMSTRQPNPPNLALGLAAPPLLASSLLLTTSSRSHISKIHNAFPAANESVDKRNSEDDSDSQLKDEARLGTGCSVLDDDVLLGGWRYGDGGVVGIACEEGRGDGGEGGGGVGDEVSFVYNTLLSCVLRVFCCCFCDVEVVVWDGVLWNKIRGARCVQKLEVVKGLTIIMKGYFVM